MGGLSRIFPLSVIPVHTAPSGSCIFPKGRYQACEVWKVIFWHVQVLSSVTYKPQHRRSMILLWWPQNGDSSWTMHTQHPQGWQFSSFSSRTVVWKLGTDLGKETLGCLRMTLSFQSHRSQKGFYLLSEMSRSFYVSRGWPLLLSSNAEFTSL